MKYSTALQARFYDLAERLFVEEGLSPQAIHLELKREHDEEAPSRRTIYVWSKDGDWKSKRRKWQDTGQSVQAGLIDAIRVAIREALTNPNRDTFSALKNAMSSARMFHQMRAMEDAMDELGDSSTQTDENEKDIEEAAYEIVREAIEG